MGNSCRYCGGLLDAHVSSTFSGRDWVRCTYQEGTDEKPYLLSRRTFGEQIGKCSICGLAKPAIRSVSTLPKPACQECRQMSLFDGLVETARSE